MHRMVILLSGTLFLLIRKVIALPTRAAACQAIEHRLWLTDGGVSTSEIGAQMSDINWYLDSPKRGDGD